MKTYKRNEKSVSGGKSRYKCENNMQPDKCIHEGAEESVM